MNRTDLAQALARRAGLSPAAARRVVHALFDADDGIIAAALKAGDTVAIGGFGRFEVRTRPARTGRNPRTSAEIRIEASSAAVFRPGAPLKQALKHWPGEEPPGPAFPAPSAEIPRGAVLEEWGRADHRELDEYDDDEDGGVARSWDVHGPGGGGRD